MKKKTPFFLCLLGFPFLLSSFSCSQRSIYFQESPLPQTALFDSSWARNTPLQKELLEHGFKKLHSDVLAIAKLLSATETALLRSFNPLPPEFASLKPEVEEFSKEAKFFANLLESSLSKSSSPTNSLPTLYRSFAEKLSGLTKLFSQFSASDSNPSASSKEESVNFLEEVRVEFVGLAIELWLKLQPLVSKWNNLVSLWVQSEANRAKNLPISAVGWTSFSSIDSNFTLANIEYLIKNLPLLKGFGDWNFLIFPALTLADYFEFLRNFLPSTLEALKQQGSFGVALKSTVYLLASFIFGLQQSFSNVETQLRLTEPVPLNTHPKISKKIKELSQTLQQRKHFTNVHLVFSSINSNFKEYLKSFKELFSHFGRAKTAFSELEEKLWTYHFNLSQSFFTANSKESLEASLVDLLTNLELTLEPKPLKDHTSFTVAQVFKNLEQLIEGSSTESQLVLEHTLSQLFETLEEEVEWFDGVGFNDLVGLSQLQNTFSQKKAKIIQLLERITLQLSTLSKNFLTTIKYLSLIGIVLERLSKLPDLPQEGVKQLSTSLEVFFKEGLWASYSKLLVLIQGPSQAKNPSTSSTQTPNTTQNLQELSAQDSIFFWINNFRNSYLAISSLLEYSFIDLEEVFY